MYNGRTDIYKKVAELDKLTDSEAESGEAKLSNNIFSIWHIAVRRILRSRSLSILSGFVRYLLQLQEFIDVLNSNQTCKNFYNAINFT